MMILQILESSAFKEADKVSYGHLVRRKENSGAIAILRRPISLLYHGRMDYMHRPIC